MQATHFTAAEIDAYRADTEGCSHLIHLNNAGASLMPRPVVQAMHDQLNLEAASGGYEAAAMKSDAIRNTYASIAALLHTDASTIALTTSATDSFARILSAIPFREGDVILTTKDDYVSYQLMYLSLVRRTGVKIERLGYTPDGIIDLDELERKLRTLQPRLLSVTHIPTNSGLVQPVKAIGEITRRFETLYALDACQSLGQMDVNVQELHCDFLSGTFRKFLRGPRGMGLLYVSPKALALGLQPLLIDLRGADWTGPDEYTPQPDARRFELWEMSCAGLLGAGVAAVYAAGVGPARIWTRISELSAYTRRQLAANARVRILDRGPELGGLITFHSPGAVPELIKDELSRRKINVVISYRKYALIDFDEKGAGWALRISPHYFNTIDEIDMVTGALREILP